MGLTLLDGTHFLYQLPFQRQPQDLWLLLWPFGFWSLKQEVSWEEEKHSRGHEKARDCSTVTAESLPLEIAFGSKEPSIPCRSAALTAPPGLDHCPAWISPLMQRQMLGIQTTHWFSCSSWLWLLIFTFWHGCGIVICPCESHLCKKTS